MQRSSNSQQTPLPPEVQSILSRLRQRLKRYTVLSGVLGIIIAAGVTFWVTTGLDAGWFALQRLELPVGLRAMLLAVMLLGALWLLARNIIQPVARTIDDRDVAVLLERRFPHFNDRLITAIEGASGLPQDGPLSSGMLDRTVHEARQIADKTEPDEVFNYRPLRQRCWLASILLLSVAGIGAASPHTLPRWWSAFIRCDATYHDRTTQLEIRVVQQPGDRRLPFLDTESGPLYRHPRGNDLELELLVPDSRRDDGQPWTVPSRVRVDVRREDGTTSRTYVSATSERHFRFVMTRLQENVEIDVLAGDFRNPIPLMVRSVAPPVLDTITLEARYPDYTRWNSLRATTVSVGGSEATLPIGTSFQLNAVSSKPLQALRIATDDFELSGNHDSSRLMPREGNGVVAGPAVLRDHGRRLSLRFHIAAPTDDQGDSFTAPCTLDDGSVVLSASTALKFTLHDQDDVMSLRPVVLRIRGIKDRPPAIDVRTDGLDRAVTRRAVIPFLGTIRDDYGLMSAGFEFAVDDETQWRPRPFSRPVVNDTTEFRLDPPAGEDSAGTNELFQVQPLDLSEGQTLTLAIVASDGCEIGAVNTARSEPAVFRVVSNEELLSLLYTREINLRRRFEEVIRELQDVRQDLSFHQEVARRIEMAADQAKPEDRASLTMAATRSGNILRRQTNELRSIQEGFGGIIRQLINNAIPPAQLSETMKKNILLPLREVVQDDLPRADRVISRFRVAATGRQNSVDLLAESEQEVGTVIAKLRRVLEDVRDMAEFHEVLSDLRAMQEEQKRILRDTKQLKRQRLIDEL